MQIIIKGNQTMENNTAPAFAAEHISHRYGRRAILSDCSVYAEKGECVGIAGRNGCGKSTFLSILAGTRKPSEGTITCFGKNLLSDRKAFSKLIGYVPQTNPLIGELSAIDNLRLLTGSNYREDDPVLQKLAVSDMLRLKVSALSGGMQRRLVIACALAGNPPVLVMDEPTSALDLYHKEKIYGNLEKYRLSGGIIIMATHDAEEMAFCSRLYLIHHGSAAETTPASAVDIIKKGDL